MFKQLLGDPNARKLKRYSPLVTDINILEDDISKLSDQELRGKTIQFREKLKNVKNFQELIEILVLIQVVKIVKLFSYVVNC